MSFQNIIKQKRMQQFQNQYSSHSDNTVKSYKKTNNNNQNPYEDQLFKLFEKNYLSNSLDIEEELSCQEISCDRLTVNGNSNFKSVLKNVSFETPLENINIKKGKITNSYLNNTFINGGNLGVSQSINFINSLQLNIKNTFATQTYLQIGGVGRETTISTGDSTNTSISNNMDLILESSNNININSNNININSNNDTIFAVNNNGILYQSNIIKDTELDIYINHPQSGTVIILEKENKNIILPEPKKGIYYKILVKESSDSWRIACVQENTFLGNIFNFNSNLEVMDIDEKTEIQFEKCKAGDKLEIISDGIHWIISGWINSNNINTI